MKRLACVLILVLSAGGVWRAAERYRVRHPVSGREISVPGQEGAKALLVSGWKTTPAGRQLQSGDMILSGQVSPDGKLFAFTNTGYTGHALHIVDLTSEKEIATFPLVQSWSGLVFAPDGRRIFVSSGAGSATSDIQYFDRWDEKGWKESSADTFINGYTLFGAVKSETAVSWLGISADGTLLYALNNSDDQLYILETRGGRGVGRVKVGDHPLSAKLSRDGKTLYVATSAMPPWRSSTSATPLTRGSLPRWRPIPIPTTSSSRQTIACSCPAATRTT